MKLPITFPPLIFGVLVKQKPDILSAKDVSSVSSSYLNFSYILFDGMHVPCIMLPKSKDFDIIYLTT